MLNNLRYNWPQYLGLALSAYALHVEFNKPSTVLCDLTIPFIDVKATCSKTLSSAPSHLLSYLGVVRKGSPIHMDPPNALLGVFFYLALIFLDFGSRLRRPLVLTAGITSVYLLTILYRTGDVCVLCLATHLINARLLWRQEIGGGRIKID